MHVSHGTCWENPDVYDEPASGELFPRQYFDEESDLYYNWNRYYDPSLGRYITSDPIGVPAGLNTYKYGSNNPIVRFDLLGLFDDSIPIFFGRFTAGAVLGASGQIGPVRVKGSLDFASGNFTSGDVKTFSSQGIEVTASLFSVEAGPSLKRTVEGTDLEELFRQDFKFSLVKKIGAKGAKLPISDGDVLVAFGAKAGIGGLVGINVSELFRELFERIGELRESLRKNESVNSNELAKCVP